MELVQKEFRNVVPYESRQQNDVQGTEYLEDQYLYLYFFDTNRASKAVCPVSLHKEFGEFVCIPEDLLAIRRENMCEWFKEDWRPTVGIYRQDGNKLKIKWEHFGSIVLFEGMVIANGDTVWGRLFKDNQGIVPERFYHNIEKPIVKPTPQELLQIENWKVLQ